MVRVAFKKSKNQDLDKISTLIISIDIWWRNRKIDTLD